MSLLKPMLTHSNLKEFQWSSHTNINLIFFKKGFWKYNVQTPAFLSQHKFVRLWKSQMLCEHPVLIITKININMSHPSKKMKNSSPPGQNGLHFADDLFKYNILNEKLRILVLILLKFVPQRPIDNKSALVQVMAWRRIGDEPFCKTMLTRFSDAYMRH